MIAYKRLFILVEGDTDKTFFERIILGRIVDKKLYDCVTIHEHSQKPKEYVKALINSANSEQWNADYIFVTDMNNAPCVSARKERILEKYKSVDKDKIIVVGKEIEGWYLAGLDDYGCKSLKIHSLTETDNITKEQFRGLIPRKFDSVIDFMSEVLKYFDMETAKGKNRSFRYFAGKFGI